MNKYDILIIQRKKKQNTHFCACTNYKDYHVIPEKRLALHVEYAQIPQQSVLWHLSVTIFSRIKK